MLQYQATQRPHMRSMEARAMISQPLHIQATIKEDMEVRVAALAEGVQPSGDRALVHRVEEWGSKEG